MTSIRGLAPLLILLAAILPARGWAAWQTNGNPVCSALGIQNSPVAIADGSGGIIVAWVDQRPVAPGIYAQRLLADGTIAPGWTLDGVLLSGSTPGGPERIVPDGAGGALVIWINSNSISVQRIDSNGQIHVGWPADGKLITSDLTPGQPRLFDAATDGAGGAYFTRAKFVSGPFFNQTIPLTRIDSDGNFASGWSESGVVFSGSDYGALLDLEFAPGGAGAVLIGYSSFIEQGTNPHRGYVRKVWSNGSLSYLMECDIYFPGLAQHGVYHIDTASDGAGGTYATWRSDGGQGTSYLGQHMLSNGQQWWAEPYATPFSELVVQDGTVGVWYVGRPPGTARLEVHRRLADGVLPVGWTSAGVVASQPSVLGQVVAEPFPDVVMLCWSENTAGVGDDIHALSVRQDGDIPAGWLPGGSPVCAAVGDQLAPVLVAEGEGAIACWEDQRLGASNQDIYANRITIPAEVDVEPPLTEALETLKLGPIPARDRIEVSFARIDDAPAILSVFDVTGREVMRRKAAAGVTRQSLSLTGFNSGLYLVRVVRGPRVATSRFAVVR